LKEKLLHNLWSSKLLQSNLASTDGKEITITDVGHQNTNAGPDFLNARISIDGISLVGNVEMHLRSSQWFQHRHHEDLSYQNVILHVVFEDDEKGPDHIPVLEISSYFDKAQLLMLSKSTIHSLYCSDHLPQVSPQIINDWLDQLSLERLQSKSKLVEQTLHQSKGDWEACLFLLMSRSFGFKTNADPFERLARSIGLSNIRKLKGRQDLIDALLFGQSGMLQDVSSNEDYPNMLISEYKWLRERFHLYPFLKSEWKFLRMRPRSFPSIRIAQLSAVLSNNNTLIYNLSQTTSMLEIHQILHHQLHPYWNNHYTFEKGSAFIEKNIGLEAVQHISINAFIPFMYTFGIKRSIRKFESWAIHMLQKMKAESNTIVRTFNLLNLKAKSSYESQAMVQLKNEYCNFKKCLNCAIGKQLIRS